MVFQWFCQSSITRLVDCLFILGENERSTSFLLILDENERSLLVPPTTSSDAKYKPCYFNSPMTERNSKNSENIISGTPETRFNFTKPKAVVQKRRKLHSADLLHI